MILLLVLQRIGLGVVTLFAVSALIFGGTQILPGDVATAILGQEATPQAVEAIRRSLGLHEPAVVRYGRWLSALSRGDLGTSLANGRPITDRIGFRIQNTLLLATVAAAVAVPLSIGLGILAALYENRFFDRLASMGALVAVSVPEFFVGYVLILLVAIKLAWLPSLALGSSDMSIAQRLHALILPATTLILVVIAHMMRLTRASILHVMASRFIEMATLKGLVPWRIVLQHALPNATGPIANVVVLNLAYLVVGVVVVEVVFVYPGMGQFMVDAVSQRDVPVVQACSLIFATTYVILNMLADVLATVSNPRLRHPR